MREFIEERDPAGGVQFQDNGIGILDKFPVFGLTLADQLVCMSLAGDIPHGFDRPGYFTILVIEQRGFHEEVPGFSGGMRNPGFRDQDIILPLDDRVIEGTYLLRRLKNQIDQDRPALRVKRKRVLIVPFADYRECRNSAHDLERLVPRNYHTFRIDGKRGIREEIDDICKALLRIAECVQRMPPLDCDKDLMAEFGKLGLGGPAFLEIEVNTVVDRFYHHFLASFAGKEDEGNIPVGNAHFLEESNAVHNRHLVIRDNGIKGSGSKVLKTLLC